MFELLENLGFALKASLRRRVAQPGGNHLDGGSLPVLDVTGEIDLAHRAAAQLALDLKRADLLPDRASHALRSQGEIFRTRTGLDSGASN